MRPADLGLSVQAAAGSLAGPADGLMNGNTGRRARLIELIRDRGDASSAVWLDDSLRPSVTSCASSPRVMSCRTRRDGIAQQLIPLGDH